MKIEDDMNCEIEEGIVKAPNGKTYKIKGLSGLSQQLISDMSSSVEEIQGKPLVKQDRGLYYKLLFKFGMKDPDFSNLSVEEIEKWMDVKSPSVVAFLLMEIGTRSGLSAEKVNIQKN